MTNKFAAFTSKFDEIRDKLKKQREEQESGKKGSFDNSWKFQPNLPKDKTKIAFKIRILPNVHNQEAEYPWISAPFHMYRKADGQFIYTLCPSLNDNKDSKEKARCPFCEKAAALYKTQDKMDEAEAQKIYKKRRFFVNVLVLEDPRSGEDNQKGKVLVYEYGKKLQEKFEDALVEQRINIFDPLAGHDFNLIIKKQSEFPNYDSSNFSIEKTPISKNEEELNTIFDSIHNLKEKILGRGPQSYEKLVQKMNSVPSSKEETVDSSETIEDVAEVVTKAPAKTESKPEVKAKSEVKVEAKAEKTASKEQKSDDDFDFNFDEE